MINSDTPRTDSMLCEFAKELERELKAANADLSAVHDWIENHHPEGYSNDMSHCENLYRIVEYHCDKHDDECLKMSTENRRLKAENKQGA